MEKYAYLFASWSEAATTMRFLASQNAAFEYRGELAAAPSCYRFLLVLHCYPEFNQQVIKFLEREPITVTLLPGELPR